MRAINWIIWHCAATPEGRDVQPETIRDWHLQRGWSDIGYHYVITLDGTVHEGRPLERPGAHVRGQNRDSIGICYVGGVDRNGAPKDTRTPAQIQALHALTESLVARFPEAQVAGHNQFAAKACPSFNAAADWAAHLAGKSQPLEDLT
ncbi:MAG: N-acetylmuramoyl-L-alanine amidase [Rhodospirillaceae bacterium]